MNNQLSETLSTGANQRQNRPTIGFFAIEISNDYALWSWQGIVDAARQHDVNLITYVGSVVASNLAARQANVLYDLARNSRLDGLIIWKAGLLMTLSEVEAEKFCKQYNLPVVTLEGRLPGSPCVTYDNYQGMRAAVEHLIEVHGYQKIGFLGMYEHVMGFQERYQAYVDAMTAHGLPIDPTLARPWFPAEQISAAMIDDQVLSAYLDEASALGLEAVISVSDSIAQQTQRKLQQRGARVPDDVAVVGFDDFTESRVLNPPMTTVRPPWYEFGQQAVETLLDLLAGKPVPELVSLPAILQVRQSCGCQDPCVVAAAAQPGQSPVESPADMSLIYSQVAAAVLDAAQASGIESIQAEVKPLLEKFTAELTGEKPGVFVSALEGALQRSTATVDELSQWHNVMSALRQHILPQLNHNGAAARQAETLLQQAQVLVGRVAERAQMMRGFQASQQENRLRDIGLSLITMLDVNVLMDTLAGGLPGLDIPGCYLSLFENPQPYQYPDPAPDWARLILAYNPHGRVQLEPLGQRFPARQLMPDELWPQDRACSLVLLSLHLQQEQIGFVLFETGSRHGKMYETLRGQISSALKGALLVQRVQERSGELARQQYILDNFMENVPDIIYFKDLDSRITRANRTHAVMVGLDDPAQLIGKSDFDFYTEDQARVRYEQEQEIIRTGRPILNLEETDGKGLWVLTTKMPLRNEQGQIIGTFGLSHNITDQVRAKQVAEAAENEAEQARRAAEVEKERAEAAKAEADKARKEAEAANQNLAVQIWQTTGQTQLNDRMRGEQDIVSLAANIVKQLCEYLKAESGALYVAEENVLKLAGTYAYRRRNLVNEFKLGEGRVGEAAVGQRAAVIRIPDDYITTIFASAGELLPKNILVSPFVYEGHTIGVVEMESLTEVTPTQMEFLNKALEGIAIAFTTARARVRVNELLAETQQQAEILQAQEEELRAANEELEAQTESLRQSQEKLQSNQSELEAANAELEEKAHALQEQRAAVDRQNQDLKLAQQELERKAEELTLASKYKSEFLANMSHELRTPLNSLLILAGMLAKNEEGNLKPDQVESAQIIHSGGTDLLNLINDILDLSKVEAGKMEFRFAPMSLARLAEVMRAQFAHVAESKGVEFKITVAEDAPTTFETDQQRVEQIIKNMLSNAFKFTAQGQVELAIYRPGADTDLSKSSLKPGEALAFSVSDTGIGMTPAQQKIVFEAFQQADGSTSRQYGGTGLGLAISRELALKLGGQIELTSEKGQGSTFTLYLPVGKPTSTGQAAPTPAPRAHKPPVKAATLQASPTVPPPALLPDDRDNLQPDDHVLLVVEDDAKFAKVTYDYAHKKGFKCLLAGDGESGLRLVKGYPINAIILDLNLPGMSGWEVLDALKNDADTRHIPVHIMSVADEDMDAYKRGAMGFLSKPISQDNLDNAFQRIEQFISRKIKSLLLVEDDANLRKSVRKLLEGSDVVISEANRGQTALELLASQPFDCMILDLSLPDMNGFELLNRLDSDEKLTRCPVIVYTGKALSEEENQELLQYADSVIVKGVKSPERLLDETALFLHRVVADLPEDKQRTIKRLHDKETVLAGKVILIVDDDARNAFALNKLLADKGLKVHIAINGQKAIEFLDKSMVDLVLMDIMMPGMDGYEVMKQIRCQPRFRRLPILALTAKAMKGDREKCIAAGASDYLAKPIDTDRLFSMLRVWLSRE